MSFFQTEDESDSEKVEKKRFGRFRAHKDTIHTVTKLSGKVLEDVDNDSQLLSEEQELEQLRKHSRYQVYAASKKSQQHSPPSQKKLTPNTAFEREEVEEVAQKTQPHDPASKEEVSHVLYEARNSNLDAEKNMKFRRESQRKRRKPNPDIDPKIIDDSSSDDSSGSGEEDVEEAPLGPALPHPHIESNLDIVSQEGIPVKSKVQLGSPHNSYVTGIAIDNAGNRLVSVSLDSEAKMWDFNSMNSNMIPFRTFKPLGESPLRTIEGTIYGGQLLCSGRANSAVVMDREGSSLAQTMQGDMYIVDAARTKGHTASIAAAKWHPYQDSTVSQILTTSLDGTIRTWDVSRTSRKPMIRIPVMTQLSVRRLRNRHGGRIIATAFDWMHDRHSAVFGCSDGTMKVFDVRSSINRPAAQSAPGVKQGEEVTGMCCSPSSTQPFVLVRSTDDCLRVYDSRRFKEPLATFTGLPNSISETNVCFLGPSGDVFATGTSTTRKSNGLAGSIRIFSIKEMKEVMRIDSDRDTGSVISLMWKESLNQLIVGTGSGDILVYYDMVLSQRGVLNCLTKTANRKVQGMASVHAEVAIPGSSFMPNRDKRLASVSNVDTEIISKRTGVSLLKPSTSSLPKRNVGKSATLAQHLSKQEVSKEWSRDPREALLQYADVASKDPQFTKVYEKTQPLPLLAEKTAEEEEEESRKAIYDRDRLRKFRKHTGSDPQ
ncbi:WD40/YVTN repeat-like containing protein [Gracilaria domingensis]|nr:WD40/YVTN repeat-like containing protein [Gracilaria domingensis]